MNPEVVASPVSIWMYVSVVAMALAVLGFSLYRRELRRSERLLEDIERMTQQASQDLLQERSSGLLTRAGFDAALDQAMHSVDSHGGTFSVLYIALDNFGLLNDAFGQSMGDKVLNEVSVRLGKACRQTLGLSRVTSGEFALLVSGDATVARAAAMRISTLMTEPFGFESFPASVTCSVGVATYPEHGSRAKIVSNAALAMRSVKLNGGADFCMYDHNMGMELRDQSILLQDLRGALENGQLELFFQPKIDARSLQVTAAEALLRWHHPERGSVSPMVFIPLAERYGLIGTIGNWVIEEACRTAAGWRERGLRMRVAVNISGYQMREDDLVERIEAALSRFGLQPGRFTCEITESLAMEDTKVTQSTLEKMRRSGFHVSIDDFGTGYSSLATLRRLKADELKIDRAFVTDLEHSEDARLIANSIVGMARALKLRVVAEGVETIAQCNLLVEMGCDELQGYLFSRPICAKELERLALDVKGPGSVAFRASLYSATAYFDAS